MKPMMGIKQQNEGELAKTRYWANIGGSGISPDILERTGFWSESIVNKMREKGIDTSQSIEQIFGGIIKFKPLPGRESELLRYNIMSAINLDLQIRKMINHVDEEIVNLLKEKWNEDDMSLLPDDLPEEKKKMIISKSSYIIADDPNTARPLLSARNILKGWKNGYGYWSGLFAAANTMFGEMALYGSQMAMQNMAIREPSKNAEFMSLDDMADHAVEMIMEG